jgi:hypothetical protein
MSMLQLPLIQRSLRRSLSRYYLFGNIAIRIYLCALFQLLLDLSATYHVFDGHPKHLLLLKVFFDAFLGGAHVFLLLCRPSVQHLPNNANIVVLGYVYILVLCKDLKTGLNPSWSVRWILSLMCLIYLICHT